MSDETGTDGVGPTKRDCSASPPGLADPTRGGDIRTDTTGSATTVSLRSYNCDSGQFGPKIATSVAYYVVIEQWEVAIDQAMKKVAKALVSAK